MPPDHAKSTYFTKRWCIWRIGQSRDWRVIIVSETNHFATQATKYIANQLEHNRRLLEDFGIFKGERDWMPGKGQIGVLGRTAWEIEYNVLARGAGQQIQGLRASEIICDDVVDTQSQITEKYIEELEFWFYKNVMSRPDPDAIVRIIGTRQHLRDLYGVLARKTRTRRSDELVYEHINFPALRDPVTGEPSMDTDAIALWPEYWSVDKLWDQVMDRQGGTRMFQLVYQQNPATDSDVLVPLDWIEGDGKGHPGCLDRDRYAGPPDVAVPGCVRVLSIDPSVEGYWAMIAMDVYEQRGQAHPEYAVKVYEIVRGKFMVRDATAALVRLLKLYQPREVIVEKNLAGPWLQSGLDWEVLCRANNARFLPHTTSGRNKADNDYGLQSLGADFEMGRIRLPYADIEARSQSLMLIHEATTYPFSATTDCLMALWFPKPNLLMLRNRLAVVSKKSGFTRPPRLHGRSWTGARERMPA